MANPILSQEIKEKALELGFDLCGISRIRTLDRESEAMQKWIEKGYHGQLGYMQRNTDKRHNPALLLDDAKSVISVMLNYFPQKTQNQKGYILSKYAYGVDYHFVVKDKLQQLETFIQERNPQARFRRFTDSAPVFDKAWAIEAGLGWLGKNSMLINPKKGSFFFVGELISDMELTADSPFEKNYCGSCTKCIDACPTGAIEEAYQVNATKCISYHTIEIKDDIPEELAKKFQGRFFGCDICQDVCPWNQKSSPHNEEAFIISDELALLDKEGWENLSKLDFNRLFKNSPLKRAGYEKVSRTIESLKPYLNKNS